jgi:hypothetical protein
LWLWKTSWMPHEFPVGQRLFCHGTVVIRVQSLLENFAQSWPAAHSGGCTRKVFCCACRHESGRTWHLATSRWSVGCSSVAQWHVTFLQPMLGSMAIENHPFSSMLRWIFHCRNMAAMKPGSPKIRWWNIVRVKDWGTKPMKRELQIP